MFHGTEQQAALALAGWCIAQILLGLAELMHNAPELLKLFHINLISSL